MLMPLSLEHPLNQSELSRLNGFLRASEGAFRSLEALDGFFAALIVGPRLIAPSECLFHILGDDFIRSPAYRDLDQVQDSLGLMLRHWNGIAVSLEQTGGYQPLLSRGATAGRAWARGFMQGVELDIPGWRPLLEDPAQIYQLEPLLHLAHEDDPRPEFRIGKLSATEREACRDRLPAILRAIDQYFEPARSRSSGPALDPTRAMMPDHDGWEVTLVPLPAVIESDGSARPLAILTVTAGAELVDLTMEGHPPADPAALAQRVCHAILAAIKKHGSPPVLRIKDPQIGAALQGLPRLRGSRIEVVGALPAAEFVAADLVEHFGGPGIGSSVAQTNTWRGWGLAPATIARFFTAAAEYYRAAPWELWEDGEPLRLEFPDGNDWLLSVLGNAGEQLGLSLFLDPDDFARVASSQEHVSALAGLAGAVVSICFASRDELTRPMQNEILAHGWEVAATDGYPTLFVVNSPTGGISEPLAAGLIEALTIVARFAGEQRRVKAAGKRSRRSWRDTASGLTLRR